MTAHVSNNRVVIDCEGLYSLRGLRACSGNASVYGDSHESTQDVAARARERGWHVGLDEFLCPTCRKRVQV